MLSFRVLNSGQDVISRKPNGKAQPLVKGTTALEPRHAGPKMADAFPGAFSRATPIVYAHQPLIFGASLLRFHPIEAALVLAENLDYGKDGTRERFLSGYSILAGLVRGNPVESYKWLFEPCANHSLSIKVLSADDGLGDLLKLFSATRFGFTVITQGRLRAMVGISDVLQLYEEGTLDTDLKAKEVASKTITVNGKVPLQAALRTMFENKVRKLVLRGGRRMVSDREIISYVFSPRKLKLTRDSPRSLAQTKLDEVMPVEVEKVAGDTPLREVAVALPRASGNTVICERGVITPWDAVMKPWLTGHLLLRKR